MLCETSAERANPEITLFRMRQVCLPPSAGGWHDFTSHDLLSYGLAAQIHYDKGVEQHALEILRQHPVWQYLTFVCGISPYWTAWLICFVLDPRWYVDPEYPDRAGRMQLFLGLRPSIQRRVSRGATPDSPAMVRCHAVLNAWKNDHQPDGLRRPGDFLWRIWEGAGGGYKGDLKASQKFLVFLRYAWLDAVHAGTTSGTCGELFSPDMLFRDDDEIDAFKSHFEKYRPG
jgi:hypothetical protein